MSPAQLAAEKLVEMTPEGLNRVFFTNSGSEANDTVVKMAWFLNNGLGRPEKKKFLARQKGYHGITIASGSLTGLAGNHKDFDLPAIPVTHLTTPSFWRYAEEGESEAQFTARLLKELEDTILAEGPETIAGFIGEPLPGIDVGRELPLDHQNALTGLRRQVLRRRRHAVTRRGLDRDIVARGADQAG